jgi:hypothetical protein
MQVLVPASVASAVRDALRSDAECFAAQYVDERVRLGSEDGRALAERAADLVVQAGCIPSSARFTLTGPDTREFATHIESVANHVERIANADDYAARIALLKIAKRAHEEVAS